MSRHDVSEWDGFVFSIRRITLGAAPFTILTLSGKNFIRPERQLLVVDPFEEYAACMIPKNLINAQVEHVSSNGKVAKSVGAIKLKHGIACP